MRINLVLIRRKERLLTLLLFMIDKIQNGLDDHVIQRSILLFSNRMQTLEWIVLLIFLRNVDRDSGEVFHHNAHPLKIFVIYHNQPPM